MEEKAAKKEAHRQAARRAREKTKENQQSRDNYAPIENIEEIIEAEKADEPIGLDNRGNVVAIPQDTDPAVRVEWFMWHAKESVSCARADNLAGLKITPAMCRAAAEAAAAWSALHQTMMETCDG